VCRLELSFSRLGTHINVEDPGLIPDKLLDEAWSMLSDFVIDMLDELGVEPTDEEYRAYFLEVCYRLVYREMTTLYNFPIREDAWKDRLGTNKRGPSVKRTTYDQ
jgi:hypothetical protein